MSKKITVKEKEALLKYGGNLTIFLTLKEPGYLGVSIHGEYSNYEFREGHAETWRDVIHEIKNYILFAKENKARAPISTEL
jgi:hypothetical protein